MTLSTGAPVKRMLGILLVLVLISVSFVACGTAAAPNQAPANPTTAKSTASNQKVSLTVPGPGTLIFLPFEVAKAQGYFAEQGIDIEFTYSKGGPPAVSALNSGSVQFVGTTIDLALNSYKQNKTITMVTSLTRLPAFAVVTAPGKASTITSLKDLEGKSVGNTNVGAGDELILRYLLKKQGADPSKVNFVAVGPDEAKLNALRGNKIDAAILQEPTLSLVTSQGGRILANMYDQQQAVAAFGSGYQFTGLVTRPDVIQNNPDLVQKMVNAVIRAEQYIATHSGEEIVKPLPDEIIVGGDRAGYARVLDQHKATMYSQDGMIVPAEVQLVARVQQDSGALTGQIPDMALFYTDTFVKAAKK